MDLSFTPKPVQDVQPLNLRIKIPSSFKALRCAALSDNSEGAVLRAQIDGVLPKVGMKRRKSVVNGLDELVKLDTPDLHQEKRAK